LVPNNNSVALVRKRTIPTERPLFVGEVSTNFCGQRDVAWSAQRIPYGRNLNFLDRVVGAKEGMKCVPRIEQIGKSESCNSH
jgi:hypothetical protein